MKTAWDKADGLNGFVVFQEEREKLPRRQHWAQETWKEVVKTFLRWMNEKSENELIKTKNTEMRHGIIRLLVYTVDVNSLYLFIFFKLFKSIIEEIR